MAAPAPAAAAGEAGAPVAALPDELLSAVFALLEVHDRARASFACRRWRSCALDPSAPSTALRVIVREEYADAEARMAADAAEANARALAALRSPFSTGVTRLSLHFTGEQSLGLIQGPERGDPQWPAAAAVGDALPRTLRRLLLSFGHWPDTVAPVRALRLHETAPDLALLAMGPIHCYTVDFDPDRAREPIRPAPTPPAPLTVDRFRAAQGLRHPSLRVIEAPLGWICPRLMLAALPALTHVRSLYMPWPRCSQEDVFALADSGVRVGKIHLEGVDLASHPFALAACAAALYPRDFSWDSWERPSLTLDDCTLPASLPEPLEFPPGLRMVVFRRCVLHPPLLRRLLEALHDLPDVKIEFDEHCSYPDTDPGAFFNLLERHLSEHAYVQLCWPLAGDGWAGDEQFEGGLRALASIPKLLRIVWVTLASEPYPLQSEEHCLHSAAARAALARFRVAKYEAFPEQDPENFFRRADEAGLRALLELARAAAGGGGGGGGGGVGPATAAASPGPDPTGTEALAQL
eukprot:tig00021531_g22167.t1